MLSSIGVTHVAVIPPRSVGIISTGDELVAPSEFPAPGQVRDINSYTLFGAVAACGGEPHCYGIVGDDYKELRNVLERVIAENDYRAAFPGEVPWARDVAMEAIDSMGKPGVLFHGISIKPGKPALGAMVGDRPVFGLPGHPALAMVFLVFDLLVAPLIRSGEYLVSKKDTLIEYPLQAEIVRNLRSAAGREDFIRVRLFLREGRLCAEPVLGILMSLVRADGMIRVPRLSEGYNGGDAAPVEFFRPLEEIRDTTVIIGSHDIMLDILTNYLRLKYLSHHFPPPMSGAWGACQPLVYWIAEERYDLCIPAEYFDTPYIQRLLEVVSLYDLRDCGKVMWQS